MNRVIACAALAGVVGLSAGIAQATEIETFDSPNQLQTVGGNYTLIRDGGTYLTSQNPTQTFGPTFYGIATHPATGQGGYGTGYHNIFTQNKPPPGSGLTNGVIDISGNNMLQLDVTINNGTGAGLFIDLMDGEGDFWQYFYGFGLTGNAANDSLSPSLSPGETITQGALPNEEILRVPLATPHNDIFGTTMFDLTQLTLYRIENDPGTVNGNGNPSDVSFYDLSAVLVPSVWNVNSAGDWNTGSNWANGLVPNALVPIGLSGLGAEADFFGVITSPVTVSTSVAVTVGTLNFNNANTYTLGGTGSLTLQTSSGNAQVIVQQGTQNISLPLTIASPTVFNVSPGATLQIAGPLTVNAGESLSQTGTGSVSYQSSINVLAGGSITFSSPSHATSLTLASTATAAIAPHTSGAGPTVLQFDSLSFTDASSKLNLTNNEVITTASASTVRGYIVAGNIYSNSTGGGVGYLDIGGGKAEARFTLLGDTNLDGKVDVTDLGNLASSYGAGSGAQWVQGDTNYDGKVDVTDLGNLASNYGGVLTAPPPVMGAGQSLATLAATSAVPEPASVGLLALSVSTILRRRRRG